VTSAAPPAPDHPVIRAEGLYKRFGGQVVLRGVDLDVMPGEILAIVGRSGAGKSVLLKNLIGLLKPDEGSVQVAGQDVHRARGRRLSRLRERFGMLFQGGALFDSLSVADNVAFPLREKTRQTPAEVAETVAEMLTSVGLQGMDDKFPAELSGGMRKRAALARALAHRPEIMLFDEPTTGLDPIMVRAIHRLIADTQQRFQYTAVVVSHEVPGIFEIASRVAMLHEGALLEVATPDAFQASANPVVQQFIAGRLEGPLAPT
jgi:phospholipid/cholesterol/gamma-HCH transport system ATP-binding protein